MTISKNKLQQFKKYLNAEEKSSATIEKYTKNAQKFADWLNKRPLNKENVICYKKGLMETYAAASVNTIISSLNSFFTFINRHDLKIKAVRLQRKIFACDDKDLTKQEYRRLIDAADRRLALVMQTICVTGIRVSELKFITIEAVAAGYAEISCKGKVRTVILPDGLCQLLLAYVRQVGVRRGCVFRSRNGNPLDRSNIWTEMKNLCKKAGIPAEKVFPHNLRHLFAKTYYSSQKDIVRLADILGHSSVNTTRIYTMERSETQRKQIEALGLLVD